MLDEKPYGFLVVIGGLGVLLVISLAAVFRYAAVADTSGVITAVGTVIGTVVGTFFGVHVGSTAGTASAKRAEAARQQAESTKDAAVGGLSKIAAAVEPDSPTARAIQQLIDSLT